MASDDGVQWVWVEPQRIGISGFSFGWRRIASVRWRRVEPQRPSKTLKDLQRLRSQNVGWCWIGSVGSSLLASDDVRWVWLRYLLFLHALKKCHETSAQKGEIPNPYKIPGTLPDTRLHPKTCFSRSKTLRSRSQGLWGASTDCRFLTIGPCRKRM